MKHPKLNELIINAEQKVTYFNESIQKVHNKPDKLWKYFDLSHAENSEH